MKKVIITSLILIIVVSLGMAFATNDETGNGAPSGKHFTLNIIGTSNPKNVNMDQGAGKVIFVKLGGEDADEVDRHTKITLTEGDDFAVLDKNGTDGEAEFMLPPPGYDAYNVDDPGGADTVSEYSVFVRPLGKPGGWATITTCADLLDSDFAGLLSGKNVSVLNKLGYFGGYASVEQVGQDITLRESKKSTFVNVTAQLTSIVFKVEVDISEEGEDPEIVIEYIRVPIFSNIITGEYWDYDNYGLKHLQVRFYPGFETDVTESDMPPGSWNNE